MKPEEKQNPPSEGAVPGSLSPPAQADVVVIGGGMVGCSVLYHLAGRADALLLEKADLTAGATWHAAGNVHSQNAIPNLCELQAYSLDLYSRLEKETGRPVGAHRCGGFFLAQTDARMDEFRHLSARFRGMGLKCELASVADVRRAHPLVETKGLKGAMTDPDEGHVDPYSVATALAAAARAKGARVFRGTPAAGISREKGRWRVQTPKGGILADAVVNCAGYWADQVARMAGLRLPVVCMEHQYLVTEAIAEVAAASGELPLIRDTDAGFYMRQEGAGLLAGTWEKDCRQWAPDGAPEGFANELLPPDLERMEPELTLLFGRVPALAAAGIKRVVNGPIAFAPDGRPLAGPLPGAPGFFMGAGFLSGIAQGGGVGWALAEWILDGEPPLDLSSIDAARFGDFADPQYAAARVRDIFPRRYEIAHPALERQSGRPKKTSAVHGELKKRGAVFGESFGWERPLWFAPAASEARDLPDFRRPNWFAAVGEECLATMRGAALSDLSSFSKFHLRGKDAARLAERALSNAPRDPGKIALALALSPKGGILGDFAVSQAGDGDFYLTGAGAARDIYRRHFMEIAEREKLRAEIVPADDIGILGLAGPKSREILGALTDSDLESESFPAMSRREIVAAGVAVSALRVSFSGEMGWELHCKMPDQPALFRALLESGGPPGPRLVGARAMGMMRLEKGYRSWGAELNIEFSPAMAGLDRACKPDGRDFIGRARVLAERKNPPARRLATLAIEADDADCWGREPVYASGELVGRATSGGFGFRVGKSLAAALLPAELAEPGTDLEVEIMAERRPARTVADPLYDPSGARLRA